MMENRVLTLDEVLALPEGAGVWVEHRIPAWGVEWDGAYKIQHRRGEMRLHDVKDGGIWNISDMPSMVGDELRIWSLSQPPTPDELQANPWPEDRA